MAQFRTRSILLFLVLGAVVFTAWLLNGSGGVDEQPPRARLRTQQASQHVASSKAVLQSGKKEAPKIESPPVEADPQSIQAFDDWTKNYLAAPQKVSLALGVKLAQERRPVFKALIMENPREAIQKAVPMVMRQKLPQEVVSLLEKRINDIGALRVFQGVPLDLNDPPVPTTREVELKSGGTYRAYVYGERANKLTWTPGASVNGVAMDSEFAISDEPTRRLEVGEILPQGKTVVGDCPVSGKYVIEPEDVPAEVPETLAAVESLRERGIPLADIVVLSARGHGRSHLLKEAKLGAFALRKFLGRYTADGEPVWSEGELVIESVHRFKGQSAMGVVLTEVDFEQLDEGARRRLFVGMTRAQLALEIVVSRAAEAALSGALA